MYYKVEKNVQEFLLPKGNGKFRKIYAPDTKYKKVLQKINKKLITIVEKNNSYNYIHAFLPDRNCITNAVKHIGYKYTLSIDLKDFFDSVTQDMVSEYLKEDFLNLCFINGIAVQGLPTSPSVANLAFFSVDKKIINELDFLTMDYVYTRYADDISISFNDYSFFLKIKKITIKTIEENGFIVNNSKTKLQKSLNGRRIITGVAVDDCNVYPTRKIKKKIRAAKHQDNKKSLDGLLEWSSCKKPKKG